MVSQNWPAGVARRIERAVPSTNQLAAAMARDGHGSAWVLANEQTEGVGRRGRRWVSPPGNFMASYLSWPEIPLAQQPQMSFVVSLALFDCLSKFAGGLALKWPNDVLCRGRKISGILLETAQKGDKFGLIAGIGVNLMHAPLAVDLEQGAVAPISLHEASGRVVTPEAFLDELAPSIAQWQARWLADGFVPIREAWLSRAAGLGTRIKARLPNKTHEGVFEDIDPTGALILNTNAGRLVLPAADVHF